MEKSYSDMGFSTKRDFEVILDLPERTRRERMQKDLLIQQGTQILQAIIAEPEFLQIDDGPVDPNNPDGPHNYHEIPMPNPMWQRYGFTGKDDAQLMLDRYLVA